MPDKRFEGNSEEFKNYLNRKMYELLRRKDMVTRQAAKDIIQRTVNQIEDVLGLSYFAKDPVMSMNELIAITKKDRNDDIAYRDKTQEELNAMKDKHSEAIQRANEIRNENPEANEHNSQELEAICDLNDEYMFLEHELECVRENIDIRRWLLGMIHRPKGYFNKADNAV